MSVRFSRQLTRRLISTIFQYQRVLGLSSSANQIPTEADVVVVGGGSVGCSTLYHLAKMGCTNSVLIEKDKLTSGTTWHTAGLLWRLFPDDILVQLVAHTREMMRDLPKETGVETGWVENGGLFIASTKERLEEYKRLVTLGKVFGIESHILSQAETLDVYPIMNVSDVIGSLYSPGDGCMDPTGWCNSLVRGAKNMGAQIFEDTPLVDILMDKHPVFGYDTVVGVSTPSGVIKTSQVILTTGLWGVNQVKKLGIDAPTIPAKHAYVIMDKVEGAKNLPNIRDHDSSIYIRLQGDALAVGGYEPNPAFWEDIRDDFVFGLFNLDWDKYGRLFEAAINRVPVLETVGAKSEICGPMSFSVDFMPMMGTVPGKHGLMLGFGFDNAMLAGGGLGRELANWVLKGRPELHMFNYDINRFSPEYSANINFLRERAHECYSTFYKIAFPNFEYESGRNIRLSPFHKQMEASGAFFESRHGWERPGWFSADGKPSPVKPYDYHGADPEIPAHENYLFRERNALDATFDWPGCHSEIAADVYACRNKVIVFDMSYFGKYILTGPDAQKAVNWLATNDVDKAPGSTIYTLMLNKNAGIEGEITVSVLQTDSLANHDPSEAPTNAVHPRFPSNQTGFYINTGGVYNEHCRRHITDVFADGKFDVVLKNITNDIGILKLNGPNSRDVMIRMTGGKEDFSNEGFPLGTNRMVQFSNGTWARLMRVAYVGELGWELHVPKEDCDAVHKLLWEVGTNHGLKNAGFRSIEALSTEKGYRFWNADIRHTDTPLEAVMMYACKLKTDTPFLGRKSLEARKAEGIKERIIFMTIDAKVPLWGLEAVYRNDKLVGMVRRAEYGYTIEKSIGLAFVGPKDGSNVSTAWIKEGNYEIERMGVRYPAKVYLKSPFDPENLRIKGQYGT